MRNVSTILKATVTLTLICALVVAALAVTNLVTQGPIAENERLATETACKTVMPSATAFEPIEIARDGVLEMYKATADGETVGYVVKTSTKGKGNAFVLMTAVSVDGAVVGLEVVSDNETAGYVNKVKSGGLFEALNGTDAATVGEVDAVAQATKTSSAVLSGVKLALEAVGEVSTLG
ncbi:MAG: FMN-binding protein [Clostridia bacterium]|nr:FMN-binding protein [Clostridia bacterium]